MSDTPKLKTRPLMMLHLADADDDIRITGIIVEGTTVPIINGGLLAPGESIKIANDCGTLKLTARVEDFDG